MTSYEFEIQAILGLDVEPCSSLSSTDRTRLTASKRVVDQNYYELDQYIDGTLATNPIFLCPQDRRQESGFEVLRLLHNYLASLYSFNETVRVLCNRRTSDEITLSSSAFTPAGGGADDSYYGRKLSFLRGLRTDFQHGGFSCLTFETAGELGEFGGYHVVFDRQAFLEESGLRDPQRFLAQTNESERRYPLCFVAGFHTKRLQSFYDDLEDWFESVTDT